MSFSRKDFGYFILLAVSIASIVRVLAGARQMQGTTGLQVHTLAAAQLPTVGGVSVGRATAPLTLILFTDHQCPYCRQFQSALDTIREELGDSLKIVFRFVVDNPNHPMSKPAATAALCAGMQGRFEAFNDTLFRSPGDVDQGRWSTIAEKVPGVDSALLARCMRSDAAGSPLALDRAAAKLIGVVGTPTIVIGNQRFDGALTAQQLRDVIAPAKSDIPIGLAHAGRDSIRLGALQGQEGVDFGEITSVVRSPAGGYFVSDRIGQVVTEFTPSGRFIGQVGRNGAGPGEYRSPSRLTLDSHGRLLILDRSQQRVVRAPVRGQGGTGGVVAQFDFAPEDFCVSGDLLVVVGYRDGAMVHIYNAAGQRIRSFGSPLAEGSELLRRMASPSLVSCDSTSETVVLGALFRPIVREYSFEGTLQWEAHLNGFVPLAVVDHGGSVQQSMPPGGYDRVLFIGRLPRGQIVVQSGHYGATPTSMDSVNHLLVSFLRTADGTIIASDSAAPSLLDISREFMVVRSPGETPVAYSFRTPR